MKNSQAKLSRALVIGVSVTLALGLIFWVHKLGSKPGRGASKTATDPNRAAAPIDPGTPKLDAKLAATTMPAVASTQPNANLLTASASAIVSTTQPAHAGAEHSAASEAIVASASVTPLTEAKSKIDAGKLLEARKILNSSLVSGKLSPADAAATKKMLNEVDAQVVFSSRRFPDDELGGTFNVPPGGVLAKIASSHEVTPDLLMRINGITDPKKLRAGQNIKILKGPFNAIIYKGQFTLELWLGEPNGKSSQYITSYPVGLGKDDSTPTGIWAVQNKVKNPTYYSPRGEGVIDAGDPKNPIGKFWIGLTGTEGQSIGKTSYGVHGTIDPSSIGKQDSMGCIRLKNEDIAQVFEMLVEGKSTVTVKD